MIVDVKINLMDHSEQLLCTTHLVTSDAPFKIISRPTQTVHIFMVRKTLTQNPCIDPLQQRPKPRTRMLEPLD